MAQGRATAHAPPGAFGVSHIALPDRLYPLRIAGENCVIITMPLREGSLRAAIERLCPVAQIAPTEPHGGEGPTQNCSCDPSGEESVTLRGPQVRARVRCQAFDVDNT